MAKTNNKIRTSELDFGEIKENLKEYLRGQSEFSDYDFEGSAMSILLDVLAYNTHYNALYTNLAVNEAFLDSASKRASVVSKAKELGYVPRSSQSATAIVTVVAINNQIEAPPTLEIPQYTPFSSTVDGKEFNFFTLATHTSTRVGNQYVFDNIMIKEGTVLQYTYDVTTERPTFSLPNASIDTSTIRVLVQENPQSTESETFIKADNIVELTPNSPVFFIKENDKGSYDIEFGNGIVGKALSPGNLVTVTYIVCNKDLPNGARTFKYNGSLSGQNQFFITTVSPAFGGADAESVDDIKWNAPRAYTAQNRCVTVDDYRTIIKQYYPDARSVNVWGGETSIPPQYGKVFISLIPQTRPRLLESEKNFILNNIVNPRKPVTITPEFVDPTPITMELNVAVYYDPNKTTRSGGDIKTIVEEVIEDYGDVNLNRFNGIFKLSQLSRLIDESEPSITSNVTKIKLHREVSIIFNQFVGYSVDLGNPILKTPTPSESVVSTGFFIPDETRIYFIEDVPQEGPIGKLRLFYRSEVSGDKIPDRTVGTVNYSTGQIRIDDIIITRLVGIEFIFTIVPESYDVVSSQNQFVTIDFPRLSVNTIVENPVAPYTFVSNRF